MINSELFINLSFFDFKSVENLLCEIFFIEKKFYRDLKNSSTNSEFHNKIFNNKDNSAIFYTGLENDAEENCKPKKEKIYKKIEKYIFFNDRKYKDEFHISHKYTKTIIKFKNSNRKTKRLLSILIIIKNIDANKQKINKNPYKKNNLDNSFINYYLFPISYEDWHE